MTSQTAERTGLHRPTQEALTEFIVSLVQAFLRTGYYLPEHPQSMKAKVGLYQGFKSLFAGRHELTFILQETGAAKNILVDGPLPDTQKLGSLMPPGMGEMYILKLANVLERKDLVSFSLKESMTEGEFSRFIDVMSEPTAAALSAEGRERFVGRLKQHSITHISFVFRDDLVTPERNLPWRAQLALSRLRKDLKVVPLFHDLDVDAFHLIRKQILRDVLRPITQPALIAVMLLNSDLARTPEASEEEIQDDLVSYIPENLLVETGREALRAHLASDQSRPADERKRALLSLFLRLRSTELAGAVELIRELFDNSVIEFTALPERLRNQINVERETDRYLSEQSRVLDSLEASDSAEVYGDRAQSLLPVLEELLRRNRFEEMAVLIAKFRQHASAGGFRAPIAEAILGELGQGPVVPAMKEKFLQGKKADRMALSPVLRALGALAQPHLLEILRKTEDTWVRKSACELLLQMGPEAVGPLVAELHAGGLPPRSVAELLMVIGEVGADAPAVLQVLLEHVKHRDPRVREEAAWALCRIRGKAEESLFLQLLDDPDLGVRKRAIRCVGTVRSTQALPLLVRILSRARKDRELEALEVQVYRSLAEFPGASIESGLETEQFLINLLKECYPGGLRGMLPHRGQGSLSADACLAICETLGAIGTEASIAVLTDIRKHVEEPVRQRLPHVIQKIEARK